MKGHENLIPFAKRTEDEQRAIRSKGGKASGVSRGFKSAFKNKINSNPELFDELVDTLYGMAKGGDLKAIDMLIDLMGETVQRELLSLKRQELKLKEQSSALDNDIVIKIEGGDDYSG